MTTRSDIEEMMRPEHRKAWDAAIASGKSTELQIGAPDCGSDGFWIPSRDGDNWSAYWTGLCFDVYKGVPCVYQWTCDADGNWDVDYLENLDDCDVYAEQRRTSDESHEASLSYSRFVAKHGVDPLSEFFGRQAPQRMPP